MPKSIIVIGASIGGLAAAIRLAQAGYDVTILEEGPKVGGIAREYHARGFSWAIAPPMFPARRQLMALLQDLGREPEDYLSWCPIEPQTRYFFPDGTVFNLYRDWSKTAAEIAQIEPRDVAGYLRFLAFAARIHDRRRLGFGKRGAAIGSLFGSWLRAGPFRSAYSASSRFLRSEKLMRVLAHCASQSGGSPFAMPSTASEMAHTLLNDGLWQPRGGVYAVPLALAKLAAEFEVNIRLSCQVEQIEIERKRAIGVRLAAGGEFLSADAVISTSDPISTARYLLPEEAVSAPALRRLVQRPMSSSAFLLLLGIRGVSPQLAQQNVFFSDDDRLECDQIFRRAIMPDDPTMTLSISCKADGLAAPFNQENWLIALRAPPLSERVNWVTEGDVLRDRILTILQGRYGLNLRDRIRVEKQLKPADLGRGWRGALYGELPRGRRAALASPQIRSPHAENLYQVCGAVLPGGGLPHELLSAKAAAAMLRQALG